jgi:hypothetical protein
LTHSHRHAVQEVFAHSARPLPYLDRIQRAFGAHHDLGDVRAHLGPSADFAAETLEAQAFTFGRHIVFRGFPSLHLAAHEAAHVVQQRAGVDIIGSEAAQERHADAVATRVVHGLSAVDLLHSPRAGVGPGHGVLQFKRTPSPDKPKDFDLDELAKWPDQALRAWPMLNGTERMLIVLAIAARYGTEFAGTFKATTEQKKRAESVNYYYGPGIDWVTPRKLTGRGYRLAQRDSVHEWWVHPKGDVVTRRWDTDAAGSEEEDQQPVQERVPETPAPTPQVQPPEPMPPSAEVCVEIQTLTDAICDNAGRICQIADELGDDEAAQATCERARRSCEEAAKRSAACGPPTVS